MPASLSRLELADALMKEYLDAKEKWEEERNKIIRDTPDVPYEDLARLFPHLTPQREAQLALKQAEYQMQGSSHILKHLHSGGNKSGRVDLENEGRGSEGPTKAIDVKPNVLEELRSRLASAETDKGKHVTDCKEAFHAAITAYRQAKLDLAAVFSADSNTISASLECVGPDGTLDKVALEEVTRGTGMAKEGLGGIGIRVERLWKTKNDLIQASLSLRKALTDNAPPEDAKNSV